MIGCPIWSPDGRGGKREILDWQVANGESKAAWKPFVHRLWERGLRPENGLQAVIKDGCGELGEAIAYSALVALALELIRTTSLLERSNREVRRKFRRVCCFGSPTGAEVTIYIQVKRLNARWSKHTWWETSRSLYFDLLNLDP